MRGIDGEMKNPTAAMVMLARQDERIKDHDWRIALVEARI